MKRRQLLKRLRNGALLAVAAGALSMAEFVAPLVIEKKDAGFRGDVGVYFRALDSEGNLGEPVELGRARNICISHDCRS